MEAQKAAVAAQSGRDPEAVKKELQQKITDTTAAARQAEERRREHKSKEGALVRRRHDADKELQTITSATHRKMQMVRDLNRDAATLAHWTDEHAPEHVKAAVVGPLIMSIDVPEPSHQPLVEQAIGQKHAFAFLASTDEARDAMAQHVNEKKLKVRNACPLFFSCRERRARA